MAKVLTHYIDGQWLDDWDGPTTQLTNPATTLPTDEVALAGEAEVNAAVAAAKRAFPTWSKTPVEERVDLLKRIVEQIDAQGEELAQAVTLDMGMPIGLSRIAVGAAKLEFQQVIDLLATYKFEEPVGDHIILKEAVGVCAMIPPWNYPALQMAEKVAPALGAGCTVILKPAEITSHGAVAFGKIVAAANPPAGVFNLLVGKGSQVGDLLSASPDVDMMAFTGSTKVGIHVQEACAPTVKRVTLELGGKSAQIVLPDADLKTAVSTAVQGVMSNSGQTCAAPTRTVVPAAMRDEFLAGVKAGVEALTVGDPQTANLGPQANAHQWDTVEKYIQIGIDEGATLVTGGLGRPEGLEGDFEKGYFVKPTVFADVKNDMRIAQEEIFGPVMSIIFYDTVEEAIEIANDSTYGLAGYVTGTDIDQAKKVASQIRAGQVAINSPQPDLNAPFGGYKMSGNGRIWGIAGLEEYLETTAIVGQIK